MTGAQAVTADLAGLVLIDRYRLDQRIGRGGMADVYRGWDIRLGRPVAVKILHPHLADDPAFVERLKREAQATAALSHTNITAVYDEGQAAGCSFLVLEMVEGESLGALLDREHALPIERALRIALDVLTGLDHAHSRGVVHRDVKPHNVLLAPDGRAKLADFGIAQAQSSAKLTVSSEVLGSIHYLAPERFSGEPGTAAADIYSVGVMLYEMLVGELPFEGDSVAAIAAQHHRQEPDAPSTKRTGLPAWVDELVRRAMTKEPSGRYPSAAAMRDDLALHLAWHQAPTVTIPVQVSGKARYRFPSKKSLIALFALALLASQALLLNHPNSPPAVTATTTRQPQQVSSATPANMSSSSSPSPSATKQAAAMTSAPTATPSPTRTPTPAVVSTPTPVPPAPTPTPSLPRSPGKRKR